MIKGSIAGAAGVALLLGGAGTFALWNDTAAVAGADITAGTLTVDAADGTWADQYGEIDIASYLIVPGDTLTYESVITVDAQGDNIKAKLSVDNASIVSSDDAEDKALKAILEATTKVTAVPSVNGRPGGGGPIGGPGDDAKSWKVNLEKGDAEYLVTVTIAFPAESTDDDNAKTGTVDLSDLAVKLTQTLN